MELLDHPEGLGVAATLDCTGQLCPMPIYRAANALKKLATGQVLKVLCTDPGSRRDFPAFARQSGHELLAAREGEGAVEFYLRKASPA